MFRNFKNQICLLMTGPWSCPVSLGSGPRLLITKSAQEDAGTDPCVSQASVRTQLLGRESASPVRSPVSAAQCLTFRRFNTGLS